MVIVNRYGSVSSGKMHLIRNLSFREKELWVSYSTSVHFCCLVFEQFCFSEAPRCLQIA